MAQHPIPEIFTTKNSILSRFCIPVRCLTPFRKISRPSLDGQLTFYGSVVHNFLKINVKVLAHFKHFHV